MPSSDPVNTPRGGAKSDITAWSGGGIMQTACTSRLQSWGF